MLVFAMLLDAALGEPKWLWSRLPHPAVVMGRLIGWCDARYNTQAPNKRRGVIVILALGIGGCATWGGLAAMGGRYHHRDSRHLAGPTVFGAARSGCCKRIAHVRA